MLFADLFLILCHSNDQILKRSAVDKAVHHALQAVGILCIYKGIHIVLHELQFSDSSLAQSCHICNIAAVFVGGLGVGHAEQIVGRYLEILRVHDDEVGGDVAGAVVVLGDGRHIATDLVGDILSG